MKKSIVLIFIIFSFNCFKFTPKDGVLNIMAVPFATFDNLSQIEQFYKNLIVTILRSQPQNHGSVIESIIEIAKFDWSTVSVSNLETVDKVDVKKKIKDLLLKHEKAILNEQNELLFADIRLLCQDVIIRTIQLGKAGELNDIILTQKLIEETISEYKAQNKLFPLKASNLAKALGKQVDVYHAGVLNTYVDILIFQNGSYEIFMKFTEEVFEQINSKKLVIERGSLTDNINKLNTLLLIVSRFGSEQTETSTAEVYLYLVKNYIISLCQSTAIKKETVIQLYQLVLKTAGESSHQSAFNDAKRLFVQYFATDKYNAPSQEYADLVVKIYMTQGLKANFPNDVYFEKMQKIWAIDLMWTSLYLNFEMVPKKDFENIINNFVEYSTVITKEDMVVFNELRKLLIFYSGLLKRYEDFFTELYHTGIFYAQYMSYVSQRQSTLNKIVSFDSFLDTIQTWNGGILNFVAANHLPDANYFDTNLHNNYVAYKILLLSYKSELFYKVPVTFNSYLDTDDKNIEELLFESPQFFDLISVIKSEYLNHVGLNYGMFSGLSIEPKFWNKYNKQTLNDYAMTSKLEMIV